MEAFVALGKHPIGSLAFLLLAVVMLSFWFYRRLWIWGPIFISVLILAYYGNIITYLALIPIAVLFFCHLAISQNVGGFLRMFAVLIAAGIAVAMKAHLFKGFNNILLMQGWQLSSNSVPINWYLNFDVPMMGLFALGLYIPIIRTRAECGKMLTITIPWAVFSMIVLLGFASYANIAVFDLKIPSVSFLWLLINFFFVVIPEEAFFRGFLQGQITAALPNKAAPVLAVLVVSLLFGLAHLMFVHSFMFFLGAVLSGLLYGTIYQVTGTIESSIITHYAVNVVHFFFFSYPALNNF